MFWLVGNAITLNKMLKYPESYLDFYFKWRCILQQLDFSIYAEFLFKD